MRSTREFLHSHLNDHHDKVLRRPWTRPHPSSLSVRHFPGDGIFYKPTYEVQRNSVNRILREK